VISNSFLVIQNEFSYNNMNLNPKHSQKKNIKLVKKTCINTKYLQSRKLCCGISKFRYGVSLKVLFVICCMCDDNDSFRCLRGGAHHLVSCVYSHFITNNMQKTIG